MPRNSSGTYTLPSGNPVSSGTLIEASWANTTLSDLASSMTGSLSRAGEGGMTAALRLYDGTVSLPGLAFTNETSTGLYRAGSGDMRLAVTGSLVMQFLSTGVAVTGTLSASGNTTLSGTLAVTGASTFTGAATFNATTTTFANSTAYYPQIINRNSTNDANASYVVLDKIRGSSIIQNGDVLGNLIFRGYDGTQYLQGAYINAIISAAPGTNDMPTDLVFGTTADGGAGPTERLRISNTGAGTASADWTFYGVRVGRGAGSVSTNTAVGASALAANTTGPQNTAVGQLSLASVTTGGYNSAVGRAALNVVTTGSANTAIGANAANSLTTGDGNTAIGYLSLSGNTTASNNTAVGYQAGYSFNYTSGAGYSTFLGERSGYNVTTGINNTFVGSTSGYFVTTGSKNTIIGSYGGNTATLDIRTASNYIVLSDGDGNARMYFNSSGRPFLSSVNSGAGIYPLKYNTTTNEVTADTSSRLVKADIQDSPYGLNEVMQLKSRKYRRIDDNSVEIGLIADEVLDVMPEFVPMVSKSFLTGLSEDTEIVAGGVKYEKLTSVLVKAVQELKAEFDAYKEAHP